MLGGIWSALLEVFGDTLPDSVWAMSSVYGLNGAQVSCSLRRCVEAGLVLRTRRALFEGGCL